MMKKILTTVIFIFPIFLLAWHSIHPYGRNTHEAIPEYVYENFAEELNEYPDIVRFRGKIIDGSNTESHAIPTYPKGLEAWDADGLSSWVEVLIKPNSNIYHPSSAIGLFKEQNFKSAYLTIGYALHLDQDKAVPAHKKVIMHGNGLNFDGLESYTNTGNPITIAQYNNIGPEPFIIGRAGAVEKPIIITTNSKAPHMKFWLSDSEDDDDGDENELDNNDNITVDGPTSKYNVITSSWGTYGIPTLEGIGYSESITGNNNGQNCFKEYIKSLDEDDIYDDIMQQYINSLLKESIDLTLKNMKIYSELMPVIVKVEKAPNRILKVDDLQKGILNTEIKENRQATLSSLSIQLEREGSISTMSSIKNTQELDGSTYVLNAQANESGLPFEEKISLALGSPRGLNGKYNLKALAKDADNKIGTDSSPVYIDTCKPKITITVKEI